MELHEVLTADRVYISRDYHDDSVAHAIDAMNHLATGVIAGQYMIGYPILGMPQTQATLDTIMDLQPDSWMPIYNEYRGQEWLNRIYFIKDRAVIAHCAIDGARNAPWSI